MGEKGKIFLTAKFQVISADTSFPPQEVELDSPPLEWGQDLVIHSQRVAYGKEKPVTLQ